MSEEATLGDSSVPRGRAGRPWAWLLARAELARAGEEMARFTPRHAEFLRRAKLVFELAETSQRQGVQDGDATPLELELFGQAVYWALRAQSATPEEASLDLILSAAEPTALSRANIAGAELAALSAALHASFIELAEISAEQRRAWNEVVPRCAVRLIAEAQRPEWQLGLARLKRLVRVLLLVLPACALIIGVFLWRYRNLAAGAPWTTSSTEFICHPERSECGGAQTTILFHTRLEDSPWFEYDFGKPLDFSAVSIRNRSDYGEELAVPLVVEVSDDHQHYRELARRIDVFKTWRSTFATQHARYLRVRALKKTFLHLEAIDVQR